MLTLSQTRKNLFPLFKLSLDTGMVFEVVYKNKVYEMVVRPSLKSPELTRPKRAVKGADVQAIQTEECDSCGSLSFNGVCMNTRCETNT